MSEPKIKLELYLVRHGESMSNIGKVDGLAEDLRADPPLSELGVLQAKLLGERFSNLKFDHILSSGLHGFNYCRRKWQRAGYCRSAWPGRCGPLGQCPPRSPPPCRVPAGRLHPRLGGGGY